MHRLAISYDKLRKSLQRHYARLRAQLKTMFPELLKVLRLDTLTARHLLARYLLPEDFLTLDLDREAAHLMAISRGQHGCTTLLQLQALAHLARQTPYHTVLVSLKGVSDLLAALFIAEVRDPHHFPRPKQIERLAGHGNRTKNLVAALPQLLALITVMLREARCCEERPKARAEVARFEAALKRRAKQRRRSSGRYKRLA